MKSLTPVEELFQLLWDTPKDKLTWFAIKNRMLEKEKEVIMDAYEAGSHTEWDEHTWMLVEKREYYNETFNNEEK